MATWVAAATLAWSLLLALEHRAITLGSTWSALVLSLRFSLLASALLALAYALSGVLSRFLRGRARSALPAASFVLLTSPASYRVAQVASSGEGVDPDLQPALLAALSLALCAGAAAIHTLHRLLVGRRTRGVSLALATAASGVVLLASRGAASNTLRNYGEAAA